MLTTVVLLIPLVGCADESTTTEQPASADAPVAASDTPKQPATPGGQTELSLDMGRSSLGWVGAKVTGSHDGGFTDISGDVLIDDGRLVGARATIEVTSLFSDAAKLTSHLLSADFFDMASFPTSTFSSTLVETDHTQPGIHNVTGNLTLHGRTHEIKFPATITMGEDTVHAVADFTIDRTDFGIDYPGKADNLIKNDVQINLDLYFGAPQAPTPAE